MSNIQEALEAVKIRIAFIGHPNEPKDWSKEVALIEAALLEAEPEPREFTKEIKATGLMEYESTKHSIIKLKEACNEIDRLEAELSFTKQELGAADLEIKAKDTEIVRLTRIVELDEKIEQALKGETHE